MIIAYGGGLTLSLYPMENPIEILENSLKNNDRYIIENENDFISVNLTAKYVDDFIKLWEGRLRGWELDLFKDILRNVNFETRLDDDGYFSAIIHVEEELGDKIHDKIFSTDRTKKGFSDELKSHLKDLFESVYKKSHQHTYIRYYEIFCHLVIIEDDFNIDQAKESIYNHFHQKLMNNIMKPTMNNMDVFEKNIKEQTFLGYVYNILGFIGYSKYISNRAIFLRRNVWAMNYIKMCLKPSQNTIQTKNLFLKDLEGSAQLLNSRKEVIESIKNSIGYHISFASTFLGFFGVLITIIFYDPNLNKFFLLTTIIMLVIILSILTYFMFNSVKRECGFEKS